MISSILDTPMQQDNHVAAGTIREYLGHILTSFWLQQAAFSAKKPLGEPWTTINADIHAALVEAGHVGENEQALGHTLIFQALIGEHA